MAACEPALCLLRRCRSSRVRPGHEVGEEARDEAEQRRYGTQESLGHRLHMSQDAREESGGLLQQPSVDSGLLPEAVIVLERSLQLDHVLGGRALEVIQALGDPEAELVSHGRGLSLTQARVPNSSPVDFCNAHRQRRLRRILGRREVGFPMRET